MPLPASPGGNNIWSILEAAAWALEQVKSRESGRDQEGADERRWAEKGQEQQQKGEER